MMDNDELELTELRQAERFAREFLDSPWALFNTRLLSRVFLVQQARLAEVKRERDAWKLKAESEGIRIKWRDDELAAAERKATELEREREALKDGKFAAVQRAEAAERKATEAAREALTRLIDHFVFLSMPAVTVAIVRSFRDREYPAPTERKVERTHCGCWADRAPNEPCVCPTPPQAELRRAGIALYEAGRWSCDGLSASRQARLWEDLRDALGLPEGHATTLGVATPPQAAPEPLVLVVKVDDHARALVLTPADCRCIVETARKHKENAE